MDEKNEYELYGNPRVVKGEKVVDYSNEGLKDSKICEIIESELGYKTEVLKYELSVIIEYLFSLSNNKLGLKSVKAILSKLEIFVADGKKIKLKVVNVEGNSFSKKNHKAIRKCLSSINGLMGSGKNILFMDGNNSIEDIRRKKGRYSLTLFRCI